MPYLIEPMRLSDIAEVMDIEREAYTNGWPASAFRREIRENRLARYVVVREVESFDPPAEPLPPNADADDWLGERLKLLRRWFTVRENPEEIRPGRIVGYLGLWLMVDEAHITNVAVRDSHRRLGLAHLLLLAAVDISRQVAANVLTLEVRVSNQGAQTLYDKFGFTVVGRRKGYYSDNREDALIMTTPPLDSPEYQERLRRLREVTAQRVGLSLVRMDEK
ncbi:MAG TPA: ribosomal protein S18-alanine N-acetyltransferase [Dehalococcoidia bacterium]|nr:ribosomal protein S18-alanine N-acetyltransferase [Dehalococcoidia bacterium]